MQPGIQDTMKIRSKVARYPRYTKYPTKISNILDTKNVSQIPNIIDTRKKIPRYPTYKKCNPNPLYPRYKKLSPSHQDIQKSNPVSYTYKNSALYLVTWIQLENSIRNIR